MRPGDFSSLAKNYSNARPGYSRTVLNSIVGALQINPTEIDVADVGAGTGIWTRMLSKINPKTCTGIEPNISMLNQAKADSHSMNIKWVNAPAEEMPLKDESLDYLSMASSFHWTDFSKAINEFRRVLRPGGAFTLLWNPRYLENNPKLLEIESWLGVNLPKKRVSSGLSGVTVGLAERLEAIPFIEEVVYIEGKDSRIISIETYINAWRSVNDVQSQLGEAGFDEFIEFIKSVLGDQGEINVTNLTRSWTAILS